MLTPTADTNYANFNLQFLVTYRKESPVRRSADINLPRGTIITL